MKENNIQDITGGEEITNTQFGFRSAEKSKSNPDTIYGYLNSIYNKFLKEQELDEQGLKERIAKLKGEVQQEQTKKNDTNAELLSHKTEKENKGKELEELEIEKINVKQGNGIIEVIPFAIASFIVILLTLYLFVFYSSSGYSAFYGIKPGTLGFINPDVFTDAIKKGGGVIALIIFFPVIFLGLGFLIHDSLEKNKALEFNNKPQKYGVILSLLTITFIADVFIGYKISQGVHTNEFNAGLTEQLWDFSMIFSDINFYMVLTLGFVVYVIWGFLLNYVLSHPYIKPENERTRLMIEHINNRIGSKRKEILDIELKINRCEGEISTCDTKIQEKKKDIIGYENGVIPINVASLKGYIGEFMGGWFNYTNGYFSPNEAQQLIGKALKNQEEWTKNGRRIRQQH
jgi:hypothetical protein